MKKVVLVLMAFVLLVNISAAQTDTIPAQNKKEKRVSKAKKEADQEAMLTELGLTDDQKIKYREIITNAATKAKAIKDNTTMTEAEKETAKKDLTTEKNNAIKELLGAEKYKQHNAIKKRQKDAEG
jgi:hypothetical protein